MKRNRQPSNLIIFIFIFISYHSSSKLYFDLLWEYCTRSGFFSDEAPQWCHAMMPDQFLILPLVHPQLDQNILLGWAWVWSYILKRHLLVLVTYYECYENYTLLPEFWIINSVSALPTSSLMLSHIMAVPGPASRWLMILQDLALTKPKTGWSGQELPHMIWNKSKGSKINITKLSLDQSVILTHFKSSDGEKCFMFRKSTNIVSKV